MLELTFSYVCDLGLEATTYEALWREYKDAAESRGITQNGNKEAGV